MKMHVFLTHFSNLFRTLIQPGCLPHKHWSSSCFCLPRDAIIGMDGHTCGCWGGDLRSPSLGKLFPEWTTPTPLPCAPICSSKPEVAHYYFVFNMFGRVLHCKSRLYVNTVYFESFLVPCPLSSERWLLLETHTWSLDRSFKVEKLAQ